MPPSFAPRITKYDPADRDGHGHCTGVRDTAGDHGPDDAEYQGLATRAADARAACALPLHLDERHPLFCAVLPDSDGVLRTRGRPGSRGAAGAVQGMCMELLLPGQVSRSVAGGREFLARGGPGACGQVRRHDQ